LKDEANRTRAAFVRGEAGRGGKGTKGGGSDKTFSNRNRILARDFKS